MSELVEINFHSTACAEQPINAKIATRVLSGMLVELLQGQWIAFVQEAQNFTEELHAVLFQHHGVRAFTELNVSFIRCFGQCFEQSQGLVQRQIGIPFSVNQKGRHGDFAGVVHRLVGLPIGRHIINHAIGRTKIARGGFRVCGPSRISPSLKNTRRDQALGLLWREALEPTGFGAVF